MSAKIVPYKYSFFPFLSIAFSVVRNRASVKLFELGVWYAGGIDLWRFHTPSLPIFGIILGLLKATMVYRLF